MDKLLLADLGVGDVVRVIAGEDKDTTAYRFTVLEAGDHPVCNFDQTWPGEDVVIGPIRVSLEGSVQISLPDDEVLENFLDRDDRDELPEGSGMLRSGDVFAIFDARETPPRPKSRQVVTPAISRLFVRRLSTGDEEISAEPVVLLS